jgi:hypothetical protein
MHATIAGKIVACMRHGPRVSVPSTNCSAALPLVFQFRLLCLLTIPGRYHVIHVVQGSTPTRHVSSGPRELYLSSTTSFRLWHCFVTP